MFKLLATELLSQGVPVSLLPIEGLECFVRRTVLGCQSNFFPHDSRSAVVLWLAGGEFF